MRVSPVFLAPILALTVTGACARSTASVSGATAPGDASRTRILVSAREVRVVFPRDTASSWGWSNRPQSEYAAYYTWKLYVTAMDAWRTVSFLSGRAVDGLAERMTLDSLLARGGSLSCWTRAGSGGCETSSARAFARDGRVILSITDSATIRLLFSLRPQFAHAAHIRPGEPDRFPGDTIVVEYVVPQVPTPNAALRAESERLWKATAPPFTYRHVGIGSLWLTTRDSVQLTVTEMRCAGDLCRGTDFDKATSWAIDDSTVASVRPAALSGIITARRPGRTTLRVTLPVPVYTGPPNPSWPSSHTIEREVVVTPPVERVELTARTDTIRARAPAEFRALAFDGTGTLISGAPFDVRITDPPARHHTNNAGIAVLTFDSAGRYTVVATFAGRADTLSVQVRPPR